MLKLSVQHCQTFKSVPIGQVYSTPVLVINFLLVTDHLKTCKSLKDHSNCNSNVD